MSNDVRVIILVDIDGVFCPLDDVYDYENPDYVLLEGHNEDPDCFPLDSNLTIAGQFTHPAFSSECTGELQRIARMKEVDFFWLTSWGDAALRLAADDFAWTTSPISLPILTSKWDTVMSIAKLRKLPIIWIDDQIDDIRGMEETLHSLSNHRAKLIRPNSSKGLTRSEMVLLKQTVSEMLRGG